MPRRQENAGSGPALPYRETCTPYNTRRSYIKQKEAIKSLIASFAYLAERGGFEPPIRF